MTRKPEIAAIGLLVFILYFFLMISSYTQTTAGRFSQSGLQTFFFSHFFSRPSAAHPQADDGLLRVPGR